WRGLADERQEPAAGAASGELGAQLPGQGENDVLGLAFQFPYRGRTQLAQAAHYVLYQALRRRGDGGQADALPAGQPFVPNVPGPRDQVGGDAGLGGQLAQAVGIGGIDRTNHQHQVALRGQTAHGVLAVLRGIADVVAPWTDDVRKALPQGLDDAARVVYGKRGLGDE